MADAYPTPTTTYITREQFRFLLAPPSSLDTGINVFTVSASNSLSQSPANNTYARVHLTLTSVDVGVVFGMYSTEDLFISRSEYIEMMNRTNYTLGGNANVITLHFQGQLSRTDLDTPVEITFWKTPLATENGTKTECVFWDQNLDEGFGAWSNDGCQLKREDEISAQCECNHLSQFAILVVS